MAIHKEAGKFLEMARARYHDDPVLFAQEVMNMEPTEQQAEALCKLASGKKKLAIKSGHGTGKSCLEAIAVLWFLTTRPLSRVVMTAPSARQLYDVLMAEVRQWYLNSILSDLELFRFTRDNIRINKESHEAIWFATCVSVSNPENISGMHAENILAVVDEGAGVDDEIFVRLEGVLTTKGSYIITCGNPSFTNGYFYDIFHKYQESYDLLTFNCEESDNVDAEWIDSMKEKYGEDSNIYKVRVLGEFAPLNEQVIIRREDLEDCIGREVELNEDEDVQFGVDVSSGESNDYSVIVVRQGYKELERIKIKKKLHDFKIMLARMIDSYAEQEYYVNVKIDTTGLGFQLGQDIMEYFEGYSNVEINRINFSHNAQSKKEYANVFTEMIFTFKEIVKYVSLLDIDDSDVIQDISGRRYMYDFRNRYQAEKKKDFIKRISKSPDEGDALLLAFYDISGQGTVYETYFGYDKEE